MSDPTKSDTPPKTSVKVEDRRRFVHDDDAELRAPTEDEVEEKAPAPEAPDTEKILLRDRAGAAEKKLQELQAAYEKWRTEQEQFRARLERDVDRKVELRFGDLAADVLGVVDDLDLAVEHARDVSEAEPLAKGVAMARDRFLAAIQKLGVERLDPHGQDFDPNVAEAIAVVPTEDPAADGTVSKTLQPGYKLGDRVIRPARVLVARLRN